MTNEFKYEIFDIKVNDDIYNRIINKSYIENDSIKLEDLVYIKFLHYDFNNNVKEGELIINRKIKDNIINVLKELFDNKYQINSFKLIDNYFDNEEDKIAIDRKSILDDNSYSFFYRKIYGTDKLSNHAYGLAIDINPRENPYLPVIDGKYDYTYLDEQDKYYIENRDKNLDHVITHDDLLYKVFVKNGFSWGGDWDTSKDYQHFEVDYE